MLASSRHSLKRVHRKICDDIPRSVWACECTGPNFSKIPSRRQIHALGAAKSETTPQDIPGGHGGENSGRFSGLRSKPFSFIPDSTFQGTRRLGALPRYNMHLSQLSEHGKSIECLRVAGDMKGEGIQPDLSSYNWILQACAKSGLHMEAWAILDDMQAIGIKPDRTSFHHVMKAHRTKEPSEMWNVLQKMTASGIFPNAATFSILIDRYLAVESLEMALQLMIEQNARRLAPDLITVQGVITLACRAGHPRLALDIANMFEEGSVRRFDHEVWLSLLMASGEALYADGVTQCWSVIVHDLGMTPDEGICIDVLHTAARHGLPELATDALRILKRMGAILQEHHFAPVISAFCAAKRIKESFGILHIMRNNNITPVADTTEPIFRAICHDIDTVDETWAILDKMRKDKEPIDVSALDVVIQAAIELGDLQRAMGTYKSYPDYGVSPTINTFNLLLKGCVPAGHRELGDRLLQEMTRDLLVKPNTETYEQIILLCLTQQNYEDAFFYLEEMKGSNHLPTLSIYEGLIKKCVLAGDQRYTLARDELEECGYQLSKELMDFIHSGGKSEEGKITEPPL